MNPSDASIVVSLVIEGSNNETQAVTKGRLTFFDLPGCDRDLPSANALHNVVDAVETNQATIPYTSSPLTMLRSDCLGGNAKTLVLLHIVPSKDVWGVTEMSLQFELKLRNIRNNAHKNEVNRDIMRLQKALDS